MGDAPARFYDIAERDEIPADRGRLIVETTGPGQDGDVLIGAYENGGSSARGATIALDWSQVNTLHEHLGRLLLESGVAMRSPMGVEGEAQKELRRARDLLRAAFHAIDRGDGQATAIQIARYLLTREV